MNNPKLKSRVGLFFCGVLTLMMFYVLADFASGARIADSENTEKEAMTTTPESAPVIQPAPAKPKPRPQIQRKRPRRPAARPAEKTIEQAPVKQASPKAPVLEPDKKAPLPEQGIAAEPPKPAQQKTAESTVKQIEPKDKKVVPPPAKSPVAKKAPPAKKKAAPKFVTIDFDNVDIGVFIKFVSELTGKNFIVDDKVRGKATILSPKKIPLEDVYKVFLSVLEVNGYAAVESGNVIKIVPAVSAREKSLETRFKKEISDPDDRLVTQIISLERANPDEIKRVLDPIVPKTGSVLSYPPAGMLVVNDYLSNIKRLQEIVNALDVEGAGDQISYVPLRNASASEVVKSLTAVYQTRRPTSSPIRIVPDTRTNSVILLASTADTENMRRLIEMMDKDLPRDESNIQVYRLQNSVAEDLAKVLSSIVQGSGSAQAAGTPGAPRTPMPVVSKNVQVVPDKATNTLVIMAEREDYRVLESIIRQLDVPRPMVYIEALIMEVNANKGFHLGVEWKGLLDTGNVSGEPTAAFIGSGGAGTATTGPGGYNILKDVMTTFPSGFSMGIIAKAITIAGITFPNIGAVVQAYRTDSEVSILSTPQIMTLNNEEAEINVGSNVPYITRQETQSTTSTNTLNYNQYEYRDVGVILKITPNINEEDFIRLKISQEVTKVISGVDEGTPTTLKRTVKTAVVVKDKETVVIGGLIGDSTEDNDYKVPFLGEIPILGWLFKTKGKSREKTNLYVFITPHVVRTMADANTLYKEKKESMGKVEEGVIKLDKNKPQPAPESKPEPAENAAPEPS
jgi:general secretion pathway protein D